MKLLPLVSSLAAKSSAKPARPVSALQFFIDAKNIPNGLA